MSVEIPEAELVPVDALRPHPRNYREHPDDQLEHLAQSLREHGLYRNVVATVRGTILAGHGVVEAAKRVGLTEVRVIRLDLADDDPKALKILAGDNELGRLGEIDDRALSEILKEIRDSDVLLGTGFSDEALANLLYVTRPATEIASFSEAAAWVGMPEFEGVDKPLQVVVAFRSEDDRDAFMKLIGVAVVQKSTRGTLSIWWPEKQRERAPERRFAADAA